ncbi:DUF805 domain-containing protein [Pseudoduganella violaceinigra]|uniref:DUF805 domain-containing protein n=1 Tax=Pseudoduganella violaceinigra TaxID=246602 RepID=UPI0004127A6C|nr:DUF805 domain-containing protein [Pseudoduganella violaceinigra]
MTNPYSMPQSQLGEIAGDETYDPKFFSTSGRIGRVRYLGYSVGAGLLVFPIMVIMIAVMGVATFAGGGGRAFGAGAIGAIVAMYALPVAVMIIYARRRLHDLGQSGWLSLLLLIPLIGFLFGLWLIFGPGDAHANEYGPAPGPNTTGVIILAAVVPVFCIIGILAAIALPSYANYKAKAEAARLENSQ